MASLMQDRTVLPEMPRFDDGMVNIQELIRMMAESLVNEIMDAQAEEACADGNQRNGYRERSLATSVGVITLRIPKLRHGTFFPEDLITRYSRTDRAVIAAISEMVTCGVSTRKVEKVASALGISSMSASQVSRICESLDDVVRALQERDLSDETYPYLWLDALRQMQGRGPRLLMRPRHRHRRRIEGLQAPFGHGRDRHRKLRRLGRVSEVASRARRSPSCASDVTHTTPSTPRSRSDLRNAAQPS